MVPQAQEQCPHWLSTPTAPGATGSWDKWPFGPPPWEFSQLSLPGRPGPPQCPDTYIPPSPLCPGEEGTPCGEPEAPPGERAEGGNCPSGECRPAWGTGWMSGSRHPGAPPSWPPGRAMIPGPRGDLPFPGEWGGEPSHTDALPSTIPRSETPPSSSGRRRSSCDPSRSGTHWPSCRSSRHSGRPPRSELRMAEAFGGQPPCHTRQPPGHWPPASADPALRLCGPQTGCTRAGALSLRGPSGRSLWSRRSLELPSWNRDWKTEKGQPSPPPYS